MSRRVYRALGGIRTLFCPESKASTTKETSRKGTKNTNKQKNKGSEKDSTNVKKMDLSLTTDSAAIDQALHVEDISDIKPRNPIWHWIGAGVFILILATGVVLYLKFKR